jgi:hypothetical protein
MKVADIYARLSGEGTYSGKNRYEEVIHNSSATFADGGMRRTGGQRKHRESQCREW